MKKMVFGTGQPAIFLPKSVAKLNFLWLKYGFGQMVYLQVTSDQDI
jgi:hypothetical protein